MKGVENGERGARVRLQGAHSDGVLTVRQRDQELWQRARNERNAAI